MSGLTATILARVASWVTQKYIRRGSIYLQALYTFNPWRFIKWDFLERNHNVNIAESEVELELLRHSSADTAEGEEPENNSLQFSAVGTTEPRNNLHLSVKLLKYSPDIFGPKSKTDALRGQGVLILGHSQEVYGKKWH